MKLKDNQIVLPNGETIPFTLQNAKLTNWKEAIALLKEKQKVFETSLHKKLYDYQTKDLTFLKNLKNKFLQGAGILNEMRTGKTPLMLTFFQEEQDINQVLIIAAPGLLIGWEEKIKEWAPRFTTFNLNLSAKNRPQALLDFQNFKGPKMGLIGMKVLIGDKPKIKGDALVIDEGHFLTKTSQQTKKIRNLTRHFPYVYILTGTPVSKNSWEIFHLASFIKPNGQKLDPWAWKEYFCQSIYNHFAYNKKEYTTIKLNKKKEFNEWMKGNFTRQKFREVSSLKINVKEKIVYLKPNSEQLTYQEEINQYMTLNGEHIKTLLVKLIRLRQVSTTPLLVGGKTLGPKLEWLKKFLATNGSRGIIVFSTHTSLLTPLASKVPRSALITGRQNPRQKHENILKFQNKEIDILFCNIVAGSKGFTLDRGEVIIFLDLSYTWENNDQAKARFWPTKKANEKPCQIYYLFLENSIESQVWQLLKKKYTKTQIINSFRRKEK